jgi:predicted transcriptional regulator
MVAMNTLTIKLPSSLDEALADASVRQQLSKSELVRRAIAAYVEGLRAAGNGRAVPSALAQAGDLAGCFAGGPADLSSNPRHMDDFGRR